MSTWPKRPIIYEINTWVWLNELAKKQRKPVTLATVPGKEWDAIAALGCDAVWFMGVWERSPAGIRASMENQGLLDDFQRALPDFTAEDNVGSPYCVRNYVVDFHLGGAEGLATARKELAKRGLRLILDFVSNHVAPDHPWVTQQPDFLIQGNYGDLVREPGAFIAAGKGVFACGRDPFCPVWPDVLQLNAFSPELRTAAIETVSSIAAQCDGVRCDMAMLMMNAIFARTWGNRAGVSPAGEYWPELIGAVRTDHPGFLFMAEAYWDLEWELQQQGFDFCYDKKLYDYLEQGPAEAVRAHLGAECPYQERLVRFIENHDEPRAAATFSPEKARAAAVLATTLPGAVLLHEGQLEGRKIRLPVFLRRRPDESDDVELTAFYHRLLPVVAAEPFRSGEWRLCTIDGWPDNDSWRNLVAWGWRKGKERRLVVVNLAGIASQGKLRVPWKDLPGKSWQPAERLDNGDFVRSCDEMHGSVIYVELPPWGYHLLTCAAG
ncbi:Alpha amylase, catalytic domain [Geoalkalibacter ferrihydriticus]|uniref:Alpha-amylase n=2 Tax=Geoalkalibacter ferrihydriticus TaxID=392333 RepID=A0A0C2HKZ3_9BACT|nr:alpha-amylase family glycosyl hydrolase [Geoalkalibacter ferrihydriticus]KIH77726.1 alpha-amylase [Geoalkalibacter ferrihydriticus DSM 17813]SDL76015.1 Alpha amylase, catalytic domain [Geoalkalibacter ferrihydriticus]